MWLLTVNSPYKMKMITLLLPLGESSWLASSLLFNIKLMILLVLLAYWITNWLDIEDDNLLNPADVAGLLNN